MAYFGIPSSISESATLDVADLATPLYSVTVAVGALMLEQNDEWAVSRRYMSLESLSALSDDPVLRLSAVAA